MDGQGLFGHFNLRAWFDSLPAESQQKIFFYYKNDTTDPRHLVEGAWLTRRTGVTLLGFLALNALGHKDHAMCDLLIKKAGELERIKDDEIQYRAILTRIEEEKKHTPDQGQIEAFKYLISELLKIKPGILQCDVKKNFDEKHEVPIGHALSALKYEGKIRREKAGRSFRLYIIEEG